MKGIRFYLEFPTASAKRNGTKHNGYEGHEGNVTAVLVGNHFLSNGEWCEETVSAVFYQENSPVASGGANLEYLRERCKRIPEALAREIHPKLFVYLDQAEQAQKRREAEQAQKKSEVEKEYEKNATEALSLMEKSFQKIREMGKVFELLPYSHSPNRLEDAHNGLLQVITDLQTYMTHNDIK